MRWQHLLHAKCFKVGILALKTSLYFFLWQFQMQCFLFFSSLEHPPPCACEFLFFSSFFTFFFLGQQLLSLSLSHATLSSLSLEKKIQTLWRDTKWKIWERKKKNAKTNRETRKKEVQQFFLKFFLLLWFKPWKPWTVFRPGRFNHGLNGFMLFMYRTVFWV